MDYKIPKQFEYRGVIYSGIAQKNLDINVASPWKGNPSDVLIATYPKTGTNWLSSILPLVIAEGDQAKVEAMGPPSRQCPRVELCDPGPIPPFLEIIKNKTSPILAKTHLRYEFLQRHVEEDKVKVIIGYRNPKDTLVSYYHFYRMCKNLGNFKGTIHEWFELVKADRLCMGDIFEWYKCWWLKRDQENILVVKYEDMIKDCAAVIQKIASFCNKELTDEVVENIVEACSFKAMRNSPFARAPLAGPILSLDQTISPFFRKGKVGDWKEQLNEEESSWIDEQCKKHLDPIGLTFDYDI